MDNEKKWGGNEPEEPLDEEELSGAEEDAEKDELYERYIEVMNRNDEEDEDDIAAVAERITGVRHSRVTTAAPIRIRGKEEPVQGQEEASVPVENADAEPEQKEEEGPEYLELPKRDLNAVSEEAEEQPVEQKPVSVKKKAIMAVILAVLLLAVGIPAAVNMINNREEPLEEPNDFPLDTSFVAEERAETVPEESETEPEVVETEPETEEETEPETEPVVIPEPEYTVTLDFYDRDDITAVVNEMTLEEFYMEVGYTPLSTDRSSEELEYVIAADTTIVIDTVEYKSESVTEVLPFETEVIEIDTIPRGEKNPVSSGADGEVVRTYRIEYVNGEETHRAVESETVTKAAVNEKYELGVGGSFVGADGVTYTYSYRRTVPATYYSIQGLTYLGTMADESVAAVDTDNIPLGTKFYVKNDTYDFGVRIASDGGPKEKEWEVDIWLSPSNPQYSSFTQTQFHDMDIYYID